MAAETKIQWCHHTFNPWIGCAHALYTGDDGKEHVHQACLHCYAEADMDHRRHRVTWGSNGTRSRTSDAYWRDPLKWDREAKEAGERRRVFCASLADVFEDWQGPIQNNLGQTLSYLNGVYCPTRGQSNWPLATMDDMRGDLFALIDQTPNLDWLLLSKRPQDVRRMWPQDWLPGPDGTNIRPVPQRNVWLGTSASDQQSLAAVVQHLLTCRDLAPVLFVSLEPLLSAVDINDMSRTIGAGPEEITDDDDAYGPPFGGCVGIDWLIIGGESGGGARPCDISAVRSVVQQCKEAGVPVFVKQLGKEPVESGENPDGAKWLATSNMTLNLINDKKGGVMEEWPEDLRVREFPEVETEGGAANG